MRDNCIISQRKLDVNITINGEDYSDIADNISVTDLLSQLSLPAKKIAVERNREIVSKSSFDTTVLSEGDRLEIIHFIGGG